MESWPKGSPNRVTAAKGIRRITTFGQLGPKGGHARDQKVEKASWQEGKRARGKEGKWKSGKRESWKGQVGKKERKRDDGKRALSA